ncbi:hypothetical protein GCM10022226_65410 [Sphaerisporangium flaviroseum]|uniref:VWA domain-containing protein n=1 Tax=Sphaerisporangium flaviroseum TaxID=509199 RepID=A0ABP7J5W0_9ACTN
MSRILIAVAALLACTACLAAGCTGAPPKPVRSCGLVVDATSFSRNTDVPQKLKAAVPKFLGGCDRVAFGVISGAIGASDCRHEPMGLVAGPEDNAQDNPTRAGQINLQRKVSAVKTMNDLLACALGEKATRNGSDVIGALIGTARQAGALDGSAKLLVISDMAHRTKELNLYTAEIGSPAERLAIISGLQQANRLPQLSGVHVTIIGFGIGVTPEAVRQQQIRDFWDLLFQKSGALPVTYL